MDKRKIAGSYLVILFVAGSVLLGAFLVSTLGVIPVIVFIVFCASFVWAAANA